MSTVASEMLHQLGGPMVYQGEGLHCCDLQRVFEEETGLYLRM
jgi:hypothetical protein